VKDGIYDGLSSVLDPSISWKGGASLGEEGDLASCDVEYGVDLDASVLASGAGNMSTLPKAIWGKATKSIQDWKLSVRGEVQNGVYDQASFQLTADAPKNIDLGLKLWGDASKDNVTVKRVEATKGMDLDDSTRLVVKPRYNVVTQNGDVVMAFAKDDTVIEVIASKDDQQITVSQQVDGVNRIMPTFTRSGAISLEWERTLGKSGNSLTTKFTPNESIECKWRDSEWTATIAVPIESGFSLGGPTVNIQRDVSF
jgi:hypothetical protein